MLTEWWRVWNWHSSCKNHLCWFTGSSPSFSVCILHVLPVCICVPSLGTSVNIVMILFTRTQNSLFSAFCAHVSTSLTLDTCRGQQFTMVVSWMVGVNADRVGPTETVGDRTVLKRWHGAADIFFGQWPQRFTKSWLEPSFQDSGGERTPAAPAGETK